MNTPPALQNLPNYSLLFRGTDLWSKYGFGDGNMLDDYVFEVPQFEATWDRTWTERKTTTFDDFCVMALVELYLLPLFDRPLTLYHASYAHNGVRVLEDEWWDVRAWPQPTLPEITLDASTILPIMFGMSLAYNAWLDGATTLEFPVQLAQTAREMAKELSIEIVTTGSPFIMPLLEA